MLKIIQLGVNSMIFEKVWFGDNRRKQAKAFTLEGNRGVIANHIL
jgi:hypothetical protein